MRESIVYVAAIAALIWILTPAIAFSLGFMRHRANPRRDPAAAEPTADDPDHQRRFRQFAALGFRPVGTTRESCWFMNPSKWYWRSLRGCLWMEAPDGKTHVSFHRLIADEPVRFGLATVLEGGGLVRTACPGAGLIVQNENYLRMEVAAVEPAELLERHEVHVMAFSAEIGRPVKAATFEEVVAADAAQDVVTLERIGKGGYGAIVVFFALPALIAFVFRGGALPLRLAIAVCAGAAVSGVIRFVVQPLQRRARILRSHSPEAARERNMMSRNQAAKQLLRAKRYEEASEEFAWLWENVARVDPAMSGVRVSFMAGEIEELAAAHPPAKQRFTAFRDAAEASVAANPGAVNARVDWVVLNKIVGDDDRTIAWFDGVRDDPAAAPVIAGLARFLLAPLKKRGRWADIGRLHPEPLEELALLHHAYKSGTNPLMQRRLGEEAYARMREVMLNLFRTGAAELISGLRAAGRTEAMKAVHEKALELDPSDEMKRALAHNRSGGP